jgi:hypothetical protein
LNLHDLNAGEINDTKWIKKRQSANKNKKPFPYSPLNSASFVE